MSPTAQKLQIAPRMLKEAKRQADMLANRITTYYQTERIKSWEDIESLLRLTIPPLFKSREFTYKNVCSGVDSFCAFWRATYEQRLELNLTLTPSSSRKIKVADETSTFGEFKLYPEQEGPYREIYNAFFPTDSIKQPEYAALQDGYPGLGKTVIACAVIARAIQDGILDKPHNRFSIHPFMIFCPRTLIKVWERHLIRAGLEQHLRSRKIVIFSDSLFTSEHGQAYCSEEEDIYTDEVNLVWNPVFMPDMVILDESHRFNNPKTKRVKCLFQLFKKSLALKRPVRFLHLSATPGEKVNDMWLFTIQTRRNYNGTFVDENSFKYFAQLITPRPDKPTRAAMKRYRQIVQNNIFSAPYVKPPHKAINVLEICEFYTARDKEIYDTAIERYLEACRKGGKNPLHRRFQMNILKRTVEPLRAPHIAEHVAYNFHKGLYASAIGVEYKETISSIAFLLNDKYNIGREHMSVIWGGRKEFKKSDLIPAAEMEALTRNPKELFARVGDKEFLKKFAISIKYAQDQYEHDETMEEQSLRHAKLRELKLLGNQSLIARQEEIDAFQETRTRIALYTAATGGIGLSLDKNNPSQLTREGLYSLGYSGRVFAQLLGRLVRRNSIADAIQRICVMRGTVEQWFLAPLIDKKLKCTAELTARDLEIDIETLMKEQAPIKDFKPTLLEEAAANADDDDTIVSDFVKTLSIAPDEEGVEEIEEEENEDIIEEIMEARDENSDKDKE